ncbi:hypothetical protein [Dialister invisus]
MRFLLYGDGNTVLRFVCLSFAVSASFGLRFISFAAGQATIFHQLC